MPVPIRSSQRNLEKTVRSKDISLNDVHFLFCFESDNSYMVFESSEKAWPTGFLNSQKISLRRKEVVDFPSIGRGKFQPYGSLDEMLSLGQYLSTAVGNVDELDITNVMSSIKEQTLAGSQNRKRPAPAEQDFSDNSEDDESDNASPEISVKAKVAKPQGNVEAVMEKEKGQNVAGSSKESGKCSSCGHLSGEDEARKDLVIEKILHVFSRIEQRLVKSNEVQRDVLILARKSAKEIESMKDASNEKENDSTSEPVTQVFYNEKCLTNLGGETAGEKGKRIARELWSKDGLAKIVVDPRKELKSELTGRVRADAEREIKFKDSLKAVLGDQYSKKVYRRVVRLVNVMGNGYKNKGFKDDEQNWSTIALY